jgi:hypothetical protein
MSASRTGLTLDPSNPDDARIMRRQQKVARQAGRDGLDRAGATRGRADLEAAYDEGAQEASAPETGGGGRGGSRGGKRGSGGAPAGGGPSAASRFRTMGPGWSAVRPTMPTTLPTRAGDAGGFLTGLALYTVVMIYIRYGADGWKGWLKAKFLNQPMTTGSGSGASANGSTPKTKKGGAAAV